jgi:hypothetical protein
MVSVAELHHFYAALAPAPSKHFDTALAAPAPTLLYNPPKFLKRTIVNMMVEVLFPYDCK